MLFRSYRAYTTEEHERVAVVKRIEALLGEGVEAREIAIIYRNNKDATDISTTLHKAGVAHSIVSNINVLHNHTIAQFITYLKTVCEWGREETFVRTLHAPFLKIREYDIYRAMLYGKRNGLTTFEVCTRIADSTLRDVALEHMQIDHVTEQVTTLKTLAENMHSTDARRLFDRAVRESGFLHYVLGRGDAHEVLACLRGVGQALDSLAQSRADYTLPDFLRDLDLYETYDIRVEKDTSLTTAKGVQLMTAHKSKGLEFSYVFIMH